MYPKSEEEVEGQVYQATCFLEECFGNNLTDTEFIIIAIIYN